MTDYAALQAAGGRVSESVTRNLARWLTWFPNERSEVEVPREDLLALVEVFEQWKSERDPSPITPELLAADGDWTTDNRERPTAVTAAFLNGTIRVAFLFAGEGTHISKGGVSVYPQPKTMGQLRTLLRLAQGAK